MVLGTCVWCSSGVSDMCGVLATWVGSVVVVFGTCMCGVWDMCGWCPGGVVVCD